MNQNIFRKYLFRKDLLMKIREKLYQFVRHNSKNAFKDQKRLLNNIEIGVIVDVGAYLGETVQFYRNYFSNSKIYCFEPTQSSSQKLSFRFKHDKNISIIDKALSSKVTKSRLYKSDYPNLNSLRKPNKRAWGFNSKKSNTADTTTLDIFCGENNIDSIDILKIDVQGSELDVLKGSKRMLEKGNISLIYIEWQIVPLYEEHTQYYKIAEFFAEYDYELFNLYNMNEARSGQIRWGDAIYTNKILRNKMISEYGNGPGSGW